MNSSHSEFVSHNFFPPEYFFEFIENNDSGSGKLFSWLATDLNVSESEAGIQFNHFVSGLNEQINEGEKVFWNKVGIFYKGITGQIEFENLQHGLNFNKPVLANKIIRLKEEHLILVGEQEKSSAQVTEMLLSKSAQKKSMRWWVFPLAIIVLSIMFLGWFFSEHGVSVSSSGNTQKIHFNESPVTYILSE
jgi:hypothetical protein